MAGNGYCVAMTSDIWNADDYLRYPMPRTQGVLDLLTRVSHPKPRLIADIGCGPGNNTELIADRWPEALVIGVDSSADMIAAARARERPGQLEFRQADLTEWQPEESFDVVLLNAVLQWIPNHASMLPRLAALLAPGGVLGIQMPGRGERESSSTDMMGIARDLTREPQWRDKLADVYNDEDLLEPVDYLTALGDLGLRAEAWRTLYAFPLPGDDGRRVVEYAAGSVLRPALGSLTPEESEQFLAEYSRHINAAYPPRVIGGEIVEVLNQSRTFMIGQAGPA
jgi:trans-aconitate 2-methyltransferase